MFIKIGDPQPITKVVESSEDLEKLKKDYKSEEKTKKEAEEKPKKDLN